MKDNELFCTHKTGSYLVYKRNVAKKKTNLQLMLGFKKLLNEQSATFSTHQFPAFVRILGKEHQF